MPKFKVKIDGKEHTVECPGSDVMLDALRTKLKESGLASGDFTFKLDDGQVENVAKEKFFPISEEDKIEVVTGKLAAPAANAAPGSGPTTTTPATQTTTTETAPTKPQANAGGTTSQASDLPTYGGTGRPHIKAEANKGGDIEPFTQPTSGTKEPTQSVDRKAIIEAIDLVIGTNLLPTAIIDKGKNGIGYVSTNVCLKKDLNGDKLLQMRQAASVSGIAGGATFKAYAFKEAWESEAYSFGYERLSGTAATEASIPLGKSSMDLKSELKASLENIRSNTDQSSLTVLNYCVEHSIRRLRVELKPRNLTLSRDFIASINEALADSNPGERLQELFYRDGIAIPLVYVLGGRVLTSGSRRYSGHLHDELNKVAKALSLATAVSIPGLFSTERQGNVNVGSEERITASHITQQLGTNIRTMGGADQVGQDAAKWIDSLNTPKNWHIIYCDRFIPVWKLLPQNLAERVTEALKAGNILGKMEEVSKAQDKEAKLYEALNVGMREVEEARNIHKFRSQEFGAKDFDPSRTEHFETHTKHYKELYQSSYELTYDSQSREAIDRMRPVSAVRAFQASQQAVTMAS